MTTALIVLAGLAIRLVLLWRLPGVHYDEAVNGLMARHVLLGEFPVFYWGQDYGGTLEALLTAVPFAVFDSSAVTLRLVPLGLSVLAIGLAYRLARAVYDEPTARLAALFTAVGPLTLLHLGVTAKNPYPDLPVLGMLLFLLALRLAAPERARPGAALVLGLVAGLAWWDQPLLVSYLAVAGLYVVVRRRLRRLASDAALVAAGFLAGSLPFWLYQILHRGESFGLVRPGRIAGVLPELGTVIRRDLFAALGASTPWPGTLPTRLVLAALAIVYLPAAGWLLWETIRDVVSRRTLSPRALPLLTAGLVVGLDAASGYASAGRAKYLFPLYGVLPLLLAYYTVTVGRRFGRAAGVLLAALVLGIHGQELARDLLNSTTPGYLEAQARPPTARLAAFLRAHGIGYAYAHYEISLTLAFDSREEIVASDWYGFRNVAYLEAVERADRVALLAHSVLTHPEPAVLEANLRALGGRYRRDEVDGFVVFHDFEPPPPDRPVAAARWTGRGAPHADAAAAAYDRNAATWWGSGEAQRPGLAYQLDLGAVHPVSHLSLLPGPVPRGAPRGLRVEVSRDAETWTEVARVDDVLAGLDWAGTHPRLDRSGRVRIGFAPVEARHIRLTETGRDRRFWWSIGEIFVYETGRPPAPSAGHAALDEGRRLEAGAHWEYIGASPIARADWRPQPGVDWPRIARAYGEAIREDPELEEAHHRLAVILSRLGVGDPADLGRRRAAAGRASP